MSYFPKIVSLASKFQKLASEFEYDSLTDEALAKESEAMLQKYLQEKLISQPRYNAVVEYLKSHPVDPSRDRRTGPMQDSKPSQ